MTSSAGSHILTREIGQARATQKEIRGGKSPERGQLVVQTMIEERIERIEERLRESGNIPEASRAELLKLLTALRDEVGTLARSHEEDARSIARFVDASAHEVTRAEKKPKLIEAALNGLTGSVEAVEASHPKLAEVVNQIAVVLSNMGL
ncbi:MAG: hypothetical protein QOE34_402 [Verrucomicrobiota bacterium]|jgi:hypothetical protein